MKFSGLKILRRADTIEDIVRYLTVELANSLRDLNTGLSRIRLSDNFEGFEAQFNFSGTSDVAFRHNLGVIPSQRIIVRASESDIADGLTPWTSEFVYMRKTSAGTATATIIFLR